MIKGYIEGYYGAILSWKDRKAILNLLPKLNLNSYLYCPKEDPKHRIQWKLDYSVDELNNFKEIEKDFLMTLFIDRLIEKSSLNNILKEANFINEKN